MKKQLKLIILILWMALIFFFSAQPQIESTETSNTVAYILYQLYSLVFNGNAMKISDFMLKYASPIRKLAHFTEFGVLGVLFYINYLEYRKDKVVLYSLISSVLYAISDEIHQLFVLNRYCSFKDMLIDSCGAITGIIIFHLLYRRCTRKR